MTRPSDEKTPKAGGAAKGAGGLHSREGSLSKGSANRAQGKPVVWFSGPCGTPLAVCGRLAQTLGLLVEKGPTGFTSGEASPLGWARRTSAYVARLRELGLAIETRREAAPDGSRIGRYVLIQPIRILEGGA